MKSTGYHQKNLITSEVGLSTQSKLLRFLEEHKIIRKEKVFSPEVMEAICKYDFPGNLIIQQTLTKYGSQREAAKALKVDQGTISRKIKKYSTEISDVIVHKTMP